MASINEVRIMGNLGQDPEVRFTQNGTAVCTLSVATSKAWTDEKTKEKRETTEWHRVVVWGAAAETVAKHKRKGDQVHVAGYLQTRKYTDDAGVERYSTEVVAGQWQWGGVLFTGKAPSNRPGHPADDEGAEPPRGGAPGDDDIPF
jgi:single-strand DNA-binding protein